MTQKRKVSIVVVVAIAVACIPLVSHWHQHAVVAAYQKTMRDTAYRAAQTIKYQPNVEREITTFFPHVTIAPHGKGTDGVNVYEVHLPPDEVRKLPLLYADMCRVCGKYRQQGYQGTLLLYDNDRIIKSVTFR
jgi:hypothetical protein